MDKIKLVCKIVSKIPTGKVAVYGQIAKLANIKSPRTIGQIIHKNPDPANIPCHRVVSIRGELSKSYAFGGLRTQTQKLKKEGVHVNKGKVNLKNYLWKI